MTTSLPALKDHEIKTTVNMFGLNKRLRIGLVSDKGDESTRRIHCATSETSCDASRDSLSSEHAAASLHGLPITGGPIVNGELSSK